VDAVVRAVAVSKSFAPSSPRSTVIDWLARLRSGAQPQARIALRDLSFELRGGEWLGVIGHNGAAKTTLLRLVAGIHRPTSGTLEVRGRVVLLPGLGIGMVDDLSVRENVILYGTIYGLSRADSRALLPSILDWAGLTEFAEARVGTLSSGMRTRLAFSCIREVRGDLWLFDEVLSAGDRDFRQRCDRHFEQMRRGSATALIATHSMDFVRKFCDRALWLDRGVVAAIGETKIVVAAYERERSGREGETVARGPLAAAGGARADVAG
jgi:ABC-type polysaccharide/polyol phosphate transport system ATPase subunit